MHKSGFSLIEILIAVFVLAMGLFLVAAAFPFALHQGEISTEQTMAELVADHCEGMIKAYGFLEDPLLLQVISAVGGGGVCPLKDEYIERCGVESGQMVRSYDTVLAGPDGAFGTDDDERITTGYFWFAFVRPLRGSSTTPTYELTIAVCKIRDTELGTTPDDHAVVWPDENGQQLQVDTSDPSHRTVYMNDSADPHWADVFTAGAFFIDKGTGKLYGITNSWWENGRSYFELAGSISQTDSITVYGLTVNPSKGKGVSPVVQVFQRTISASP